MSLHTIISSERDPARKENWRYTLACGHTVSRRANPIKRVCICGHCDALAIERIDARAVDRAWEREVRQAYAQAAGR